MSVSVCVWLLWGRGWCLIMAHAASQIKKNKDVDINALEDEKEKKRKSRKQLRDQKKKVPGMHPHTYVLLQGDWLGLWDISPVTASEFIVCVCVLNLCCSAKVTLYIYCSPSFSHKHTRMSHKQPAMVCVCVSSYAFRLKMRASHCSMFWEILLSSETCVCMHAHRRSCIIHHILIYWCLFCTEWWNEACRCLPC